MKSVLLTGTLVLLALAGASGTITTVVGSGRVGPAPDGTAAEKASLALGLATGGIAFDREGRLTFSETNAHRIRRVGRGGVVETIAGSGRPGFSGDGGPAREAAFKEPGDLAFDREGNLYVADVLNNVVRRIDGRTGIVTTAAGTRSVSYNGDGIPATQANLGRPIGIAFDKEGRLLIADTLNARIRRVDASGLIATIAGSGDVHFNGAGRPALETGFTWPAVVRVDPKGNVLFTASGDHHVFRVDAATGILTVLAGDGRPRFGGDGGPGAGASFEQPCGMTVDREGDVFVADWKNNRVRRIDGRTGVVTTVAGNGDVDALGEAHFAGDGGKAVDAVLSAPSAVALDLDGNLYIVDSLASRIRKVTRAATGALR